MPRTVLYLLRHAPTLWNLEKRIQGQWDSELAPEGQAKAEALAPRLIGLGLARILASDLGRTRATAGILNLRLRLPVTLDKRLREQHFGEWTGKYWRDVPEADRQAAEAAGWHFQPPGGESRAEVRQRVEHALLDAGRLNAGKTLLVVTHQGPIKAVLNHLLGRSYLPDEAPAFDPDRPQQIVYQSGALSVGELDLELPAP
jgi:broad specificity phosphatase PhoE